MPAGSKIDLTLAKAKPISDDGSTSVIAYLRRGKTSVEHQPKEWEYMRETTLQTPRSVNKEQEEVFQAPEQRFPCNLCRRPCPPTACGGPRWSRHPPAAHGGPYTGASGCAWRRLWACGKPALEQVPGRICGPMEKRTHAGTGFLAGLVMLWWTNVGAAGSWRNAPRGKDPCWSSLWRSAVHGLMLEKFMKNCLLQEGTRSGAREDCEESFSWGRRSSTYNMWWTDCSLHSPFSCAACREEVENLGVKLSLGRMEWWG